MVQANQLRKQQLVELGLLREEEKQKMLREHENEVRKLNLNQPSVSKGYLKIIIMMSKTSRTTRCHYRVLLGNGWQCKFWKLCQILL